MSSWRRAVGREMVGEVVVPMTSTLHPCKLVGKKQRKKKGVKLRD